MAGLEFEDVKRPFSPLYAAPFSQAPWSQPTSQTLIYCDECGSIEHESDEDGCYYCCACGALIPDLRVTGTAHEDIFGAGIGGEGGIYNVRHTIQVEPSQAAAVLPSRDEILRGLAEAEMTEEQRTRRREEEREREKAYGFDERVYEPRDFGSRARPDPESLANGIRLRYVQGLQLMVQLQCEALVEKHGVSPLICGIVGGLWLRYIAAMRIFDDGWANKAIEESEEALRSRSGENELAQEPTRCKWEPRDLHGRRAIYIWLRSLRKTIPLHATLAVSFLSCHLARQSVLPTDIVRWALETKLPYIAAFVEIDTLLGRPVETCPLRSRTLFRPVFVVSAWKLETTAGCIAETVGLHLPPVNFYAIASRYLSELQLPVERVLPMALRAYEWSMPVELCLSKHHLKLPTRVYVMAIIIVVICILYNVQGQGVWEMTRSRLADPNDKKSNMDCEKHGTPFKDCPGNKDACQTKCKIENFGENNVNVEDTKMVGGNKIQDFSCSDDLSTNTEELLSNLERVYDKMSATHDYLKDFKTYLKYCKDVICAGITKPCEEENLMERFWDMYKDEDDDKHGINSEPDYKHQKRLRESYIAQQNVAIKRCRAEEHMDCGLSTDKSQKNDNGKEAALRKLKSDMELKGFNYLPPRVRQSSEEFYLRYRRKRIWGKFFFIAHADYYILLRTCAKLVEVDCRIMHLGVLHFESRLAWLEKRISESLVSVSDGSLETLIDSTEEDMKDTKH